MPAHPTLNSEQSQSDEMCLSSSQRIESTVTPESAMQILHSGEIIKHDQFFSVEVSI